MWFCSFLLLFALFLFPLSFSFFPFTPPCLFFFWLFCFSLSYQPSPTIIFQWLSHKYEQTAKNKQVFKEIFKHVIADLLTWGMVVTDGELAFCWGAPNAKSLGLVFCSPCRCCLISKSWLAVNRPMNCSMQFSLSVTVSQNLLKFIFIELVMLSNHLILCHFLLILPSIFPSMRVFSNESALLIRWPKYWSFSFNISPSNEYSELSSFRIDLFDLLEVQGTLKSLLQHYSLKASVLWCSAFFIVQLSRLYMTTGNIIALTLWTLVGKVISLLFNTLSRCVIAFLPRSKHLLMSAVTSVIYLSIFLCNIYEILYVSYVYF